MINNVKGFLREWLVSEGKACAAVMQMNVFRMFKSLNLRRITRRMVKNTETDSLFSKWLWC